jgi:radical SAM protein with 4Fe4S-binding SPASM domain
MSVDLLLQQIDLSYSAALDTLAKYSPGEYEGYYYQTAAQYEAFQKKLEEFEHAEPVLRVMLTDLMEAGVLTPCGSPLRSQKAAVMGADAVALNRFLPTGRGRINQNGLCLKRQDLVTALELADKATAEAGIFVYTGIPVEPCTAQWELFPEIAFSTCHCGDVKWTIDPGGNLRTCEQNPEILGNLLENSFNEIVENLNSGIDSFRQWRNSEGYFNCSLPEECSGGCRFAEQFH